MRIMLTLLAVLSGCASERGGACVEPVAAAGEGVAGIVAHTESADRHVKAATPHASPTGRVYLTAAGDEHAATLQQAQRVRASLAAAGAQAAQLRDEAEGERDKRSALEGRWFVRWGRRIERALWIIGISWLVLGIASVALGMGNPLSWSWRVGKEITRLAPLMNPFSWVRDWLIGRKGGAAA